MYGLVNKAIEDLICQEYGSRVWADIVEGAGHEDEGFVSMAPYPDAITYDLVASAAERLGAPADQLLERFGEFWTLYTASEGYGGLLQAAGRSFGEFLNNLDQLHSRVGLSFPELAPPSFACEDLGEGRYRLRYRSHREGLSPMVRGLVRGLAKRFDLELVRIDVEPVARESGEESVFHLQVRSVVPAS